ncbi:helix-turn-helix transcriptional regulator [Prescottella subtropica]|uniref:helix-turn-helix transcriptional regulator n=1 Tax=Prescottella subtropica TaxID=2545757 RepID=UPI001F4F26DD|nr:ArsR family transcriptional regulator [Prescottella subtropica]
MNKSPVPLGPAPAAGPERRRPLTEPQAAALDDLRRRQQPTRVGDVAAALGLHVNTVREHLDALVAAGLAARTRAHADGRGRPAWLYDAVDDPEPDVRLRDYAGLAIALAGHLQETGEDPSATALAIGRRWGRDLARQELAQHPRGVGTPRERVLDLLTGLGFAPTRPDPATPIALRRCPLLDAARRYPDVVCRVHLGIVRGALETFGDTGTSSELTAFAEPGCCTLELGRGEG